MRPIRSGRRFTNELRLARRVTHKNVCRVFDLNTFSGTTVIAMELMEGRSLRDMLRDVESLSVRRGPRRCPPIAAGLAEAHAQGVIHRDSAREHPRRPRRRGEGDGLRRGASGRCARHHRRRADRRSGAYMSPEQAAGKPADARSDIYALGLVMYEIFCGRPAFSGDTALALVAKHLSETPVAPRHIDADLPERIDVAIRRCLEKDPARRFPSVAELDATLSLEQITSPPVEDDVPPVPDRLQRWQRADWGLLAAAAAGLAIFFPCFARVSLAPQSEVTFDRTVLHRIADEHLQRLGMPEAPLKQISCDIDPGAYVYLATTYGARAAHDAANNPVHYWTWSVRVDGASLNVDNRGRLTSFSRNVVPIDSATPSFDDARRRAAAALADFFGQSPAVLALERETRGQVYGFAWLGPATADMRERYAINIDQRGIASMSSSPDLPPGFSMDAFPFGETTMNEWGLPVAVVLGVAVCAFGFVNRRRAAPAAPWRIAIAAVAFAAGAWQTLVTFRFLGAGEMASVSVALGVLFAAVAYLGCVALEVLSGKRDRSKLDTFTALFTGGRRQDAAAVSAVRGAALGLALLGVDTLAVWLATMHLGGRLSLIHIGMLGGIMNGVAFPLGLVLGSCAVQTVGLGLLVGITGSAAARLPIRSWLGIVGAAAVLAASGIRMSMGAVQPWPVVALVLFVDYAVLLVAFRCFDLVTLWATIGTFTLWWATYPLLVMQRPIGAAAPWAVFAGWGLGIVAAAGVASEATLRRSYRRVMAIFD